ncbi:MAG: formylglycine-generating enzyme family protein [Gallionella sp.]
MKTASKLLIFTLLAMAASAYAQLPSEEFKQKVEQLKKTPGDKALRKRIVELAAKTKPALALPEEAVIIEARVKLALKNAKSSADYLDAAKEYEKAASAAPWMPGYYSDLCTIYEKAEKYVEAKESCEFFLASSPSTQDAINARKRITGLKFAMEKAKALNEAEMRPAKVFRDCPDCPDMVIIPPGVFQMGSTNGEANEAPVHYVAISRFAIGKTEVTQGQWRAIMGNNHSSFSSCGIDCPVEMKTVKWDDVRVFIQQLNAKTGKQYRLPSEAEWEYACRGGEQQEYCGSDNLDSVGWYGANSGNTTNPVGRKQANDFGLYDMSGNVWEWVEDNDHTDYHGAPADGSVWQGPDPWHVLRGGSWNVTPYIARAAFRLRCVPEYPTYFGFRLARMLP